MANKQFPWPAHQKAPQKNNLILPYRLDGYLAQLSALLQKRSSSSEQIDERLVDIQR
jgi:hypothetical protein